MEKREITWEQLRSFAIAFARESAEEAEDELSFNWQALPKAYRLKRMSEAPKTGTILALHRHSGNYEKIDWCQKKGGWRSVSSWSPLSDTDFKGWLPLPEIEH